MIKEMNIENINQIYTELYDFLEKQNFQEKYKNLLESKPILSIEKEAEYTSLIRDALYEFLTSNNYITLNPLLISFIMYIDRHYYTEMKETYKYSYR